MKPYLIFVAFVILFGVYTIYDRQYKYFGGHGPICKNYMTVTSSKKPFTINSKDEASVYENTDLHVDDNLLNSSINIDEFLTDSIEKHMGDIRNSTLAALDRYQTLLDQNTIADLKESVGSFLRKSMVVSELQKLHEQLRYAKLEPQCHLLNLTEIDQFYTKIAGKIEEFNNIQRELQDIQSQQQQYQRTLHTKISSIRFTKSKEQMNLELLKKELENFQQGRPTVITAEDELFLSRFHDLEKQLLEKLRELQRRLKEIGISPDEALHWRHDTLRRARQVIRLQIKDLPLTYQINDLKGEILDLQQRGSQSAEIVEGLERQRSRLEEVVRQNWMQQKQADSYYQTRVMKYLEAIRQIIKLKHHAFRKEKVRHTTEELEKKDAKLKRIQQYLELTEEIDKIQVQLEKLRSRYSQLLNLKENDPQSTKDQLRQKIRNATKKISNIDQEIKEIEDSSGSPINTDKVANLRAQAERLQREIEPEYQTYRRKVDQAAKMISDCNIQRMKTQRKIDEYSSRIQDLKQKLGLYNGNIDSMLTIINRKVQ